MDKPLKSNEFYLWYLDCTYCLRIPARHPHPSGCIRESNGPRKDPASHRRRDTRPSKFDRSKEHNAFFQRLCQWPRIDRRSGADPYREARGPNSEMDQQVSSGSRASGAACQVPETCAEPVLGQTCLQPASRVVLDLPITIWLMPHHPEPAWLANSIREECTTQHQRERDDLKDR